MPQQLTTAVENNFTKGLITEATGLNFPENAATDTDNCVYTLVGDVTRREGFNYEANFSTNTVLTASSAVNTYKWNNVGGDGLTQVVVTQSGYILNFYLFNSPVLSNRLLASTVDLRSFQVLGSTADIKLTEAQFVDGNGYLFVYHPNCEPFYCTYTGSGNISANKINVQIRDFIGTSEPGVAVNTRPNGLNNDHLYNLTNQGWTQGNPWAASSGTSWVPATGSFTFSLDQTGLSVTLGDFVNISNTNIARPGGLPVIPAGTVLASGSVTAYSGTSMTINIITAQTNITGGSPIGNVNIVPINHGYINGWFSAESNYPSNADVWWYFKDSTGAFNPAATQPQVSLNTGPAPSGHFVLNAFNQDRTLISGVPGITPVVTSLRPRTGTWFQGRVWYTGLDASQPANNDVNYYTWTESIYFSQVVQTTDDFGTCYQTNDPTSENLFDLLPTDGGQIVIQGSGSIFKLFPIANGLLVFAANGVWFITGSQGIGFAANDYTVTKISSVESISSTSFVDVLGLPYFWNEDGIYMVSQGQGGQLSVEPITVGTIETFYDEIPLASKKYVRGAYHPIDFVVQWVYRPDQETDISNRYDFYRVLNYNTYNKAFYPYTLAHGTGIPEVKGINYVAGPGGSIPAAPTFKYYTAFNQGTQATFSEENDASYLDWKSAGSGNNFSSYFITGYKLRGQGIKKFQPQYIQMYTRTNGEPASYYIQGIWDYSNTPNSGRWSVPQLMENNGAMYDTMHRRYKLRGRGYALQFKVYSNSNKPFDIQGWAVIDTVNQGA